LNEECRRKLIADTYIHVYGAPPPEEWGEKGKHGGLVSDISDRLHIPQGNSGRVRETLTKTYDQ